MIAGRKKEILLFLIFLPLLLLSGCVTNENKDFSNIANELFIEETTSNTMNLHYTLADPASYGIDDYDVTLGDLSLNYLKTKPVTIENYLDRLHTLNVKKLNDDNTLTYELLNSYLSDELSLSENPLYDEILSPSSGIQSQLPILFAEYSFKTEKDVEDYLSLLSQLDQYFSQAVAFETEKSKDGFFMNDYILNQVIDQCKQIGASDDNHFLVLTFNEKIDALNLPLDKKATYKEQNLELLYETVFPAYDLLIDGLEKLKGTSKNNMGLYYFPNGKSYYEDLVAYTTGSDKSISQITEMLTKQFYEDYMSLTNLIQNNATLSRNASIPLNPQKPEQIIEDLKAKMLKDFPAPPKVNYEIKYVQDSLEDYLSPAFYLTPTIDDVYNNTIYINNIDDYNSLQLFTTLAHEGYPGHLYQTIYTHQSTKDPVRNLIDYGGFIEGWALYVEMCSFSYYDKIEPDLCEMYRLDQSLQLCLYSLVDIGVNYNGWSYENTYHFLSKYASLDASAVERLYNLIIEKPANYLKYYVGYLEINNLKKEAKEKLKDKYDNKEFHKFLLEIGPAPFSLLEEKEQYWISTIRLANSK